MASNVGGVGGGVYVQLEAVVGMEQLSSASLVVVVGGRGRGSGLLFQAE